MKIDLVNNSSVKCNESAIASVSEYALKKMGIHQESEIGIRFVNEDEMSELHVKWMDLEGPTDVLSFPIDAVEATRTPGPAAMSKSPEPAPLDIAELPLLLGDVVICPSVAVAQAPRHAGTIDDELALLLVHGILHVLGNDHDTPDAAGVMQALERKHLESFHWHSTAPDNFRHVPEVKQ